MGTCEGAFVIRREYDEMDRFLAQWQEEQTGTKAAFRRLKKSLSVQPRLLLSFKSRPGVSCSLRASVPNREGGGPLFALVDIVDDDPEKRWLSVCFYEETVTDPSELGNRVPQGILGEDGYCFDVTGYDEDLLSYLEERIDEAYEKRAQGAGGKAQG